MAKKSYQHQENCFISVNCFLKSKKDEKRSKESIKARTVDARVIALGILNIQNNPEAKRLSSGSRRNSASEIHISFHRLFVKHRSWVCLTYVTTVLQTFPHNSGSSIAQSLRTTD